MSYFVESANLLEKQIAPGIYGRPVHSEQMTVNYVRLEKGAILPLHHHPHEQITNVLEGELQMTVGEETYSCKAGCIVVIPSNVPHHAIAISECRVIDVFQPVREDMR
jgi:quercetin dioxygenase-like cupin family protein